MTEQEISAMRTNLKWKHVANRTMLDGIGRTGIQAIVGGHDNQVKKTMQTLVEMAKTQAPPGSSEKTIAQFDQQRLRAMVELKELQGNLPAGTSGTVRDIINKALYGGGEDGMGLDPNQAIARQLSDKLGGSVLHATQEVGADGKPIYDAMGEPVIKYVRQSVTPEAITTMGRTYAEYDTDPTKRAQQQQQQQQ